MIKTAFSLFLITFLFSCTDFKKVPEDDFVGTWELYGRPMYAGIKVSIDRNKDGSLKGRVIRANDEKYIKMFVDSNSVWVSKIKRSSNYQFRITEKRIASGLLSIYDLGTSEEFKVEFIDKNTFGLGKGNSDPLKSKIQYKRVK